jgi:hypothetical protein
VGLQGGRHTPAAGAESVVRDVPRAPIKHWSTFLFLMQMDGHSTGSNSTSVQVVVRQREDALCQQELGKTRQEQP